MHSTTCILAFDFGRMCGVVCGRNPDTALVETWDLPSKIGLMMDEFEGRVRGLITREAPAIVAFERPMVQFGNKQAHLLKHYSTTFGQAAIIKKIIVQNRLFPVSYAVSTARSRKCGSKNADEIKIHATCHKRGMETGSNHAADAGLIWLCAFDDCQNKELERDDV